MEGDEALRYWHIPVVNQFLYAVGHLLMLLLIGVGGVLDEKQAVFASPYNRRRFFPFLINKPFEGSSRS